MQKPTDYPLAQDVLAPFDVERWEQKCSGGFRPTRTTLALMVGLFATTIALIVVP